MRFWPLSALADHVNMPWQYRGELYGVQHRGADSLSMGAIQACGMVAANYELPAIQAPHIGFIQSEGVNLRRYFNGYPDTEEWLRLERAAVFELPTGELFMAIDALH